MYLIGLVWPATAFVLFPASIGAGALLWVYAARQRRLRAGAGHGDDPDDESDGGHPADDCSPRVALALVGLSSCACSEPPWALFAGGSV